VSVIVELPLASGLDARSYYADNAAITGVFLLMLPVFGQLPG
jgi:hypothetical protein